MASDASVEIAGFDVAGHFLRADEEAFDFGVVDRRDVTAGAYGDLPTGAAEEVDGGVLEAAFGDAEFQPSHPVVSWGLVF